MREILFRGKAKAIAGCPYNNGKSDGEWVFGYIFPDLGAMKIRQFEPDRPECNDYEIDPETVGQFTGLTDKNGVRIFEGDILDVSSDVAYGGVAVHRLGYFVVEFHNGCFMKSALDDPQLSFFDNAKRKGLYHFISTDIHKIVGNIHDNPELLKGGGNNG